MKIRYNPDDDVLVIELKSEPLSHAEEISEDVIAHYSDNEELIEIEILDASELFRSKNELIIPARAGRWG